jgi:DNA-binding SARP family transcriptional activator
VVVHVGLVGRLRIGAGGQWMDDAGLTRHDRLVLAYLTLARDRRVSRDELADLVWEDRVPASWKTALRGVVSRVRAALAGIGLADVLTTGSGWYELRLPDSTVIDVESAAAQVAAAVRLLAAGDPVRARDAAGSALEVARQPFLPGVHALWVEQRQELLEDLRLRALEVTADAGLESGDWSSARVAAEQAVALAPLRESHYRRLAVAHSGAGDRGVALEVLARCRRVLAEEVGADASPETEALSLALLRGDAVPVNQAHRYAGPMPGPSRASALPARLADRSTPFVNRTGELAALRAAWQRAIAGTPEVVVVAGEAGAGKTRLIAEFSAALMRPAATVLYGRGEEAGPIGPGPLLEALDLDRFGSADSAWNPAALAERVRRTLAGLTAAGPVLLVLDDLQWVDQTTFSMLRHAMRDPLPLLVAATFRTGEPGAAQRLTSVVTRLRRECSVRRIDLAGLTPTEVGRLVEVCAGVPAELPLVGAVADATAGNPFFVQELLLLLLERATAVPRGGVLTLDSADLPFSVPDTVRDVIVARHQRLSAPARRVLAAAAVFGREVDLSTLELVPELSRVDVLSALEEVVASHLMVERPDHNGHFAFVHGLVQETLYQEISAARRRRLHLDAATVLEGWQGGPSATASRLAYHLLRGGPDAAERATIAAARAGAEAAVRHAYEEAATEYAAALDVAGTDPAVRCRLTLELAGARWRAGETARARRDYEAAAEEASAAGRTDLAVRAVFGAVGHGPTLGRCDEHAVRHLTAVLGVIGTHDPFMPRLMARLGAELAGESDPRAVGLCDQALDLAKAHDDQSTTAFVLNCRNWAGLNSASNGDGLRRANQILTSAEAVGDQHMLLEGHLWRSTYHLRSGNLAAAETEVTALEQAAVDLRQPFYLRLPFRLRACLALARGEPDEAERFAADAYTVERRVHPDDAEVHALVHAVAVCQASGRWHNLGPRLADALAAEPDAPHWRAFRGVQLAAIGKVGPAIRMLRPLLAADAGALRSSPLSVFTLLSIARASADNDRLAREIDLGAVHRALLPWHGTHAVAGCGVASLGPVDRFLLRD